MHTLLQYCTPRIYPVSISLIGGAELTSKKKSPHLRLNRGPVILHYGNVTL